MSFKKIINFIYFIVICTFSKWDDAQILGATKPSK